MSSKPAFLFGTCLIDNFYPEAGLDSIHLLSLAGYKAIYPQSQTCCGQPAFNSGYQEQCSQIAQQTVDTFLTSDAPLIVPSASCAGMIKNHYPQLLGNMTEYKEKALTLANKTFELVDFIIDKLPYESLEKKSPTTVTLHESCAALRETDSAGNWKEVLRRMPNVSLRHPTYPEECCGFGGTFSVKSPDVSLAMTKDKLRCLQATDSQVVVSGDCGCLLNLNACAQKQGQDFCHQHIASFLRVQFDGADS